MAEVTGLAELAADIAASNAELTAALPSIVMRGATIVESEISARAPRHTGQLVAHLDAVSSRHGPVATATVQIEESGAGGVEHYAIFKEYGTSKMAATPYFRPGVLAATDRVEDGLEQGIGDLIDRHDR